MNNIDILFYFSFFLFGLAVGSFLNVLIYRLPKDLSIFGRSFCPHCKKKITWHDNIPIISFILLRGKCRYCHSPISFYYPTVELITGILFLFTFLFVFDWNFQFSIFNFQKAILIAYYLFLVSSLIAIFFTDLKYGIIPDKIVYPSILASVGYLFLIHNSLFIINLLSAFGAFAFLLSLFLITRGRGMGFGDVKLAFLMGLFLGFPKIVIALYVAFLTGAAISLILVLWGKKKFFGGIIPFGPFLAFGTLLAFFFGEELLGWASHWLNLLWLLP